MKIVGYCDPLHVAPGDTVRFMVSSEHETYQADLVRLVHGDNNPLGPGFKAPLVGSEISGEYTGRTQVIRTGSSVQIPWSGAMSCLESFTVTAWVLPTTPAKGRQSILTQGLEGTQGEGFGLFVGGGGDLEATVGDGDGGRYRAATAMPLAEHQWTFAAMSYDAESRKLCVYQIPVRAWPIESGRGYGTATASRWRLRRRRSGRGPS